MRIFVFNSPASYPHFCTVERNFRRPVILSIMQKYLYILTLLLLSVAHVNGQGWERIYGGSGQDAARSIASTPDGGYVMAGYYNGNSRIFLIKTDADGKQQWSKQIIAAGPSSLAEAFAVVATKDTGYAIAGYIDVDANGPTKRQIYLLKTDAYGEKIWDQTFGGSLDDEARALVELNDGSLLLSGFQSYAGGTENIFALKTDSEGGLLWFNTYGQPEYRRRGHSIVAIPNGDFIIAGESKVTLSTVDDKDALALRINSNGALVWDNKFSLQGSLGNQQDDEARAVTSTVDGFFVLAGITKPARCHPRSQVKLGHLSPA